MPTKENVTRKLRAILSADVKGYSLLMGKSMISNGGIPWAWQRSNDGLLETPLPDGSSVKGKSWIEDNMICDQYNKLFDGVKYCMDIYRNPNINEKTPSEYMALCDIGIIPFSVKELD